MWGSTPRREDDAYAAFAAGPQTTMNPPQHHQPPPPQQGPPQGQGGPPVYNAGGWGQHNSENSRLELEKALDQAMEFLKANAFVFSGVGQANEK